jgi:hypothetical protein
VSQAAFVVYIHSGFSIFCQNLQSFIPEAVERNSTGDPSSSRSVRSHFILKSVSSGISGLIPPEAPQTVRAGRVELAIPVELPETIPRDPRATAKAMGARFCFNFSLGGRSPAVWGLEPLPPWHRPRCIQALEGCPTTCPEAKATLG